MLKANGNANVVYLQSFRVGLALLLFMGLSATEATGQKKASAKSAVKPVCIAKDQAAADQDDLCFWIHPADPSKSTMIGSDKASRKLFVYDLSGKTLQTIDIEGIPGNIDTRYGFQLADKTVDIIGLIQREEPYTYLVYAVDRKTGRLSRVDNGKISTEQNLGGCLYKSPKTGKFFAFAPNTTGSVQQFELSDDGTGKIQGKLVRTFDVGSKSEGFAADDETGTLYIAAEDAGVLWKFNAEPDGGTTGKKIADTSTSPLDGKIVGVAIYRAADGRGCILVSSRGNQSFVAFDRKAPHKPIGLFRVENSADIDGIDVAADGLGAPFITGCFAAQETSGKGITLSRWSDVAEAIAR